MSEQADYDHLDALAKVHRVLLRIGEDQAALATDVDLIRCTVKEGLDAMIADATEAYRQEKQWSAKMDLSGMTKKYTEK